MIQFHILSFEGPDPYACAGGLATRVTGLTEALAKRGFKTHLWFIGAPDLPGYEVRGGLRLHRWCQWISRFHPAGVYDGDEGKQRDYASSLPPYLMRNVLSPHLGRGGRAVVLAEEWQTVDAVLHLDWLLRVAGTRDKVAIFWNANNTFEFARIDWGRLSRASDITTVSRYMKKLIDPLGLDALVVPNGLSPDALLAPEQKALDRFRTLLSGRTALCKVARWDADKGWLTALDIVRDLKHQGANPLLLARGGVERYGDEVLQGAGTRGLRVVERYAVPPGVHGLLDALQNLEGVDIVSLKTPVDSETRRVLFRGSDTVLANSTHEPFGLVGLETMAVAGLACTGSTGEDYAVPGQNALVMESGDSQEFLSQLQWLRREPLRERAIRRAARMTAKGYSWNHVLEDAFLPRVHLTLYPEQCRPSA